MLVILSAMQTPSPTRPNEQVAPGAPRRQLAPRRINFTAIPMSALDYIDIVLTAPESEVMNLDMEEGGGKMRDDVVHLDVERVYGAVGDDCPACMEVMTTPSGTSVLACGHMLHTMCWNRCGRKCPLCRQ